MKDIKPSGSFHTTHISREIGVFLLWNIYMTDKMVEAYLKALERARKHLSFQNGQLVFLIKNGSDIYIRRFIQVHFRNVQFME